MTHFSHEAYQRPIPLEAGDTPPQWQKIPIHEVEDDPLVAIGPYANHARAVFTTGVYAGEHTNSPYYHTPLRGATLSAFVRRSVANKLEEVQAALPPQHHLLVFDGYRSAETQTTLYTSYRDKLAHMHPHWDATMLDEHTQRYVSLPSFDPPSPHRTGGAIDLAIVRLSPNDDEELRRVIASLNDPQITPSLEPGQPPDIKRRTLEYKRAHYMQRTSMLYFGTDFDQDTTETQLTYYELLETKEQPLRPHEKAALYNRRLLFHALGHVGIRLYAEEWWHGDDDRTQRASAALNPSPYAALGGVELDEPHLAHEAMRRTLYRQPSSNKRGGNWPMRIIEPCLQEGTHE